MTAPLVDANGGVPMWRIDQGVDDPELWTTDPDVVADAAFDGMPADAFIAHTLPVAAALVAVAEAFESIVPFLDTVVTWTGSDPDELDDVLSIARAALDTLAAAKKEAGS